VLVGLYILLIGLAAWGSWQSFLLRQRCRQPFLKTYHIFVLLSFAYAVVNFIGEVFAAAVFAGPAESLVPVYMIVDLITIPLLGVLFFLLFAWITRLAGRPVPAAPKAVFWGIETLYLAAFIISFISYFVRGITNLTYAAVAILNGIVLVLLIAAGFLLFFAVPAGADPARRRISRGLGTAYAASVTVLIALLAVSRMSLFREAMIGRILPAGFLFLVNLPAIFYLRKSLEIWLSTQGPASPEDEGLAGLARDAGISDREKEIIRLLARGLDNREIGKTLFISPKTVKNHLTSIYAKTGARNRVQLANRLNRPDDGPGA